MLDGLALAGGLNEFADTDEIVVLRRGEGAYHRIEFDYAAAAIDSSGPVNMDLQPGDIIVVR